MAEVNELAIERIVEGTGEGEVQQRSGNVLRRWRAAHVEPAPRRAGVDETGRNRRDEDAATQIVGATLAGENADRRDLA